MRAEEDNMTVRLGLVVAYAAAIVVAAAGCRSIPAGPNYEGKTAAEWLDQLRDSETNKSVSRKTTTDVGNAIDCIGPAAIPALTNALATDKAWLVREHAAAALGRMGGRALNTIPALIEALGDEHFLVWEAADSALNSMIYAGDHAILLIAEGIKHPNPKIRKSVIAGFGAVGSRVKAAVPAITEALKDNDASVREAAADALREIEGK